MIRSSSFKRGVSVLIAVAMALLIIPYGFISLFTAADATGVSSVGEFKKMDGTNGEYELTKDITINWGSDFVNTFSGTLDGNGYTIYIQNGNPFPASDGHPLYAYGLFRSLTDGGTLKNLRVVVKNKLTCRDLVGNIVHIGLLAGRLYNGATIKDCVITGVGDAELYAENLGVNEHLYLGSIAGAMQTSATVTNCFSDLKLGVYNDGSKGNFEGNEHYVGGIVGKTYVFDGINTAVTDCLYSGEISGGYSGDVSKMCFFGGAILGASQMINESVGAPSNYTENLVVQRNYCTYTTIDMNKSAMRYTNATAIGLISYPNTIFNEYSNVNNNYMYQCDAVTYLDGARVGSGIFLDQRASGGQISYLVGGNHAYTYEDTTTVLGFANSKYAKSSYNDIPNLKIVFDLEYRKPKFTVEQNIATKDVKATFEKADAIPAMNSPDKRSELDKTLKYRYTYKGREKLQTPQAIYLKREDGIKKGPPSVDSVSMVQIADGADKRMQYQCRANTKNVTIPPTWSVTSVPQYDSVSITPRGVLSIPVGFDGTVTVTAKCGNEAQKSETKQTHKVTAPKGWILNTPDFKGKPLDVLLEGSKLSITAKPDMTKLESLLIYMEDKPPIGGQFTPIMQFFGSKHETALLKLIDTDDTPEKIVYGFEGNNGEFLFDNLRMPDSTVNATDFNLTFKEYLTIIIKDSPKASTEKSGSDSGVKSPPVAPHSSGSGGILSRSNQDLDDWHNRDQGTPDPENATFHGEFQDIDFGDEEENKKYPKWMEKEKSKNYWYRIFGGEWQPYPITGIDMKKGITYEFRYELDGYNTSDVSSYKVKGTERPDSGSTDWHCAWLDNINLGTTDTSVATDWKYVDQQGNVSKDVTLVKGKDLQPGSSYSVEAMYETNGYYRPKDYIESHSKDTQNQLQKPTITLVKRLRTYNYNGTLASDTLVDTIEIKDSHLNKDSVVYYTVNGGTQMEYSEPIDFPYTVNSLVIKAWSHKEGYTDSNVVVETFTKASHSLANMPSVRIISKQDGTPPSEEFNDPTIFKSDYADDCPITASEFPMNSKIEITNAESTYPNSSTDKSVKIFYTLDGSLPTSSSNLYNAQTGIILPDTVTGDFRLRTFITSDFADTQIREIRVKIRGDYKPPVVETVSGHSLDKLTTKEALIFKLDPSDVTEYFDKDTPEVAPQIIVSVTTVDGSPIATPIVRTLQTQIGKDAQDNVTVQTVEPVNLNTRPGQRVIMSARVVGTIQGATANSSDIDIPFEIKGAAPSPVSTPASGSVLPDTTDPIFLDGLVNSTMYYSSKKISVANDFILDESGVYTLKEDRKSYIKLYEPSEGIAIPSGISTGRFTFYAITIPDPNSGYEPSLLGSYGFSFAKIPFIYPVTASQPSGKVPKSSQVVLRSTTPGAVIFYTLTTYKSNGDVDITINNTVYDGTPIIIDKKTKITAYAEKDAIKSTTESFLYEIADSIPPPSPSIASGSVVAKGTVITLFGSSRGNVIYTKDGSDPSLPGNKSAIMGNQIIIDGELGKSMTFRAYCAGTGYTPSPVITLTYTISDINGGIMAYPTPDVKVPIKNGSIVTLTSQISNAKIYYTTNGDVPTTASSQGTRVKVNGTPGSPFTIKAIAVADGTNIPVHVTFTYTLQQKAQQPAINGIPSGSIVLPGAKISMSTKVGTVYYTMDGTTPTAASQQYVDKIEITSSVVVKAVTIAPGMETSDITVAVYTFAGTASPPIADKSAGKIDAGTKIALSTATPGATIYYSTNSVDPTVANLKEMFVYTDPITITRAVTIKMIAYKKGMQPSAVNTMIYTVNDPPPPPEPKPEVDEVPETTTDRLASRRNFANKDGGPMFDGVVLKSKNDIPGVLSCEAETISKNSILDIQQLQMFPTDTKAVKSKLGNYDIVSMYDVNVLEDGVSVIPKGQVEVGFPIPAGYENSVLVVCSFNDDGTVVNHKTRRAGGMAYVVSETLGKYALVAPSENSSGIFQFTPMLIALILLIVACIAIFTFFMVRRNKSKREQNR